MDFLEDCREVDGSGYTRGGPHSETTIYVTLEDTPWFNVLAPYAMGFGLALQMFGSDPARLFGGPLVIGFALVTLKRRRRWRDMPRILAPIAVAAVLALGYALLT